MTSALPRKFANLALCVGFVAAIWVPLGANLLPGSVAGTTFENRAKAVFPEFRWKRESLTQFPTKFEAYYQDTFLFRQPFLWVNNFVKTAGLGVSPSPRVILGKEGWLFYTDFPIGEDREALRPFTKTELEQWRKLLQARHDDLATMGIGYLFVIAPDKQTIYPDYLPETMRARLPKTSRLDQLAEYLRAHSTVKLLDLRPALNAARQHEVLYYRTDSHWNGVGGYVAYREIISALKPWIPNLEPLSRDEVVRSEFPGSGDLAGMVGLPDQFQEMFPVDIAPKAPRARIKEGVPEGFAKCHVLKHLPAFVCETSQAEDTRVVFFRDSFGTAMIRLVAENFRRTVIMPTPILDRDLIRHERPQVVIQEMVERVLYSPPPQDAIPTTIP